MTIELVDFRAVIYASRGLQPLERIMLGLDTVWTSTVPPGPLTGTIGPGSGDGEIEFNITAIPSFWGVAPGGEVGTLGTLEFWDRFRNVWTELADPAATGLYTRSVHEYLWGRIETIKVRPKAAQGWPGPSISVDFLIPGQQHSTEPVTQFGAAVTQDGEPVTIAIPIP